MAQIITIANIYLVLLTGDCSKHFPYVNIILNKKDLWMVITKFIFGSHHSFAFCSVKFVVLCSSVKTWASLTTSPISIRHTLSQFNKKNVQS